MYYSSPATVSPTSPAGELLCPGCELCCDVIYCGELKIANDVNVANKKVKKNKNKNERSCVASIKIAEAIRDVQQRTLNLQRKLKTMEKVKPEKMRSIRKEKRLFEPQRTDHRFCYCCDNPCEGIRRRIESELIEPQVNDHSEENINNTDKSREKMQEETQTEPTSSKPTTEKDFSIRHEDFEERKTQAPDTKRGSSFGGCAPCGLTCGFRYEPDDEIASSDVSQQSAYRGDQKCREGCGRGSSRRRRLTGVRSFGESSFPGGKSTPRRTWCCCPCGK